MQVFPNFSCFTVGNDGLWLQNFEILVWLERMFRFNNLRDAQTNVKFSAKHRRYTFATQTSFQTDLMG
jgi:hypothetical protein